MSDALLFCHAVLQPYAHEISTALITCLLVAISPMVHQKVRKKIGQWPFLVRTLLYILLTGFGYGAAALKLTPLLTELLNTMSAEWFLLLVCSSFWLLGSWAERHRQI